MKPGKFKAIGSGGGGGDRSSMEREPLSHAQLRLVVATKKCGSSGANTSDFEEIYFYNQGENTYFIIREKIHIYTFTGFYLKSYNF